MTIYFNRDKPDLEPTAGTAVVVSAWSGIMPSVGSDFVLSMPDGTKVLVTRRPDTPCGMNLEFHGECPDSLPGKCTWKYA